MLKLFYSCYSSACWPVSSFFYSSKKTETLSPGLEEDEDDELFNDGFVKWNRSCNRKSFGSIAEDSLPRLVPEICVQTGSEENIKDITGDLVISTQYSLQKKLVILIVVEASDIEQDIAPLQVSFCQFCFSCTNHTVYIDFSFSIYPF